MTGKTGKHTAGECSVSAGYHHCLPQQLKEPEEYSYRGVYTLHQRAMLLETYKAEYRQHGLVNR